MATRQGKLIAGLGALLVVLVVGIVTYFLGYLPFSPLGVGQAKAAAEEPLLPGPMYTVKDMVVNLADPGERRYLKIGMSLEFSWGGTEFRRASADERKKRQTEFENALAPWLPRINDTIIAVVSARTVSDLSTTDGKQKLKTDIKDRINGLIGPDQVVDVLFTQFVMQ